MKGNFFKRTVAFTGSLAMLLTSGGFSEIENSVHADVEAPPLVLYDVNGNGIIEEGEKAYRIMSADELYWFAEMVNQGEDDLNAFLENDIFVNYDLMKENITVSGDGVFSVTDEKNVREWVPAGSSDYSGTFDGAGHTINGLFCKGSDKKRLNGGLFANVSGTVKNVGVKDSYFFSLDNSGSICGYLNHGTIENCFSVDNAAVSKGYAGGICGINNGIVNSCYNTGAVSGENGAGGICGNNLNTVINCYFLDDVAEKGTGTGGGKAYPVSKEQLESGEICFCLENGADKIFDEMPPSEEEHAETEPFVPEEGITEEVETEENIEEIEYEEEEIEYEEEEIETEEEEIVEEEGLFEEKEEYVDEDYFEDEKKARIQIEIIEPYEEEDCGLIIEEIEEPVCKPVEEEEIEDEEPDGSDGYEEEIEKEISDDVKKSYLWRQNIGEDPFPVLNSTHHAVSREDEVYVNIHTYKNGFCTACDCFMEARAVADINDIDEDMDTEELVYEISNAGQLYWFADMVNKQSGFIKTNAYLAADITINEDVLKENNEPNSKNFREWTPVGSVSEKPYDGVFDGAGHTVKGLYYGS